MKTTLNAIRAHGPCSDGWRKLLSYLGKTEADDEPLPITTILDSNGLEDALWCLRAVQGHDREIRLYAVWCARQVQHLITDPRALAALDVAERFANASATEEELNVEWEAAWQARTPAEEAATWTLAPTAARAAAAAAMGASWAAGAEAARTAARAEASWVEARAAAETACEKALRVVGKAARKNQAQRLREVCAAAAPGDNNER